MKRDDTLKLMKELLGEDDVRWVEEIEAIVFGSGNSLAPDDVQIAVLVSKSVMLFEGNILIGYTFGPTVADQLFNSGALDVKTFAQQFIDSYGLGEMNVEKDEKGDEYLIHRNKSGFSVKIFPDKTLDVELIKNAGKTKFD